MSTLETNLIQPSTGTTLTLGASGDTITVPSGVTIAGGLANTPAFEAYLGTSQTVTDLVTTKVQFDTEVFDTDNCYDNTTNYRFTPTVAGKYFVYAKVSTDTIAGANLDQVRIVIQKNGSAISQANLDARGNTLGSWYTANDSTTVDMNGTTDYLEISCRIDDTSGNPDFLGNATIRNTSFGAYKLIGA